MVRQWNAPDPLVILWPGVPFPIIYQYPYLYPELMHIEYAVQFAVELPEINPLQTVPVPLAQRVWTWLENIPESHLEPAVLELSPGDPSSHLSNNQAEDIIETSLAILSHDLDSNKDEAMQQNDDEFPVVPVQHNQVDLQHQYQAAYCTPTPIRGNFVPVSGASPSSSRQVLQPAVYEPADNNKNSSAAHFTARAS